MNRPPHAPRDFVAGSRARVLGMLAASAWLALGCVLAAAPAHAAPFIWDQDTDEIDDRIETVNLLGYSYSFEGADTLARQRIEVSRLSGGLAFGAYVIFDHVPTDADLLALTLLGMPTLHRYEAVPAVRSVATYAQIEAAAALSGVERIEAVPLIYPEARDGAAGIGARDPSGSVFPTWSAGGGSDGAGIVVAILDTGVNDAVDGTFPGHESLAGRGVGGAEFVRGDSLLDTPRDGSVNPVDRGGDVTHSHGTHVAGIALGTGGASGYAMGVAPGARFVDVKVLNDAGTGTGVAEALDWCIHNRARDWGAPGSAGIQVVNLSLSSLDLTDGNDLASRLANRATELGLVVVASMGNGGQSGFVPSPAGASLALAVGAMDVQRTGLPGDDGWAPFNNQGPRAGDGDGDPLDEQKPDLLAPGMAVLSADGSLTSDGTRYQRLSGTSMSAAFVSGAVAALLSSYPSLTPDAIAPLLRATARRELAGAPAGTPGADPRWRSTIGFGVLDLHAAQLELEQPERSQVAQLELGSDDSTITAVLRMQRERGAPRFVFERAPDAGGVAGTFAPYDSVAAAGDSSLAGPVNRHTYSRAWPVPPAERGQTFWYRVTGTEGGVQWVSLARPFASPSGPPAATILLSIVHDAYDHDVTGTIYSGGPSPAYSCLLPGSSAAISSDWTDGESATGTVSWSFRIQVPQGGAAPPVQGQPWRVRLDDGGYLNRGGRLTQLELIWHGEGGDVSYPGQPVPLATVEGGSVYAFVAQGTLAVDGPGTRVDGIRLGPNPVVAGGAVTFEVSGGEARTLELFDLGGRRLATLALRPGPNGRTATWEARDAAGQPLAPGVVFARCGTRRPARIAVIGR